MTPNLITNFMLSVLVFILSVSAKPLPLCSFDSFLFLPLLHKKGRHYSSGFFFKSSLSLPVNVCSITSHAGHLEQRLNLIINTRVSFTVAPLNAPI